MSSETVGYLLPEIILIAVATAIYIAGAFVSARGIWSWVALAGLAAAAAALAGAERVTFPNGSIVADELATYARWLALVVGLVLVLLSARSASRGQAAEYVGSLLLVVVGMMLTADSRDLALLFLGLELVSIPTYSLLYMARVDAASREAAAKYFFLSILSSAVMLYGFSFLYGIAGTTDIRDLARALTAPTDSNLVLGRIALVLVLAGLTFKIAAVPFHFYAPDVYQGTTNGNAAVLAVAPKLAGMVVLVRIIALAMPSLAGLGWRVSLVLAAVTMTLGNVLALWQKHIRRLLAYSSIAHAGYMLIGLAVGLAAATGAPTSAGFDGLGAVFLYLAVYAIATAGTFAALAYLDDGDREVNTIDDLAGVGRTQPVAGACLAVFMFSLAGIPPLAGFWGKFALFGGALAVGTQPEAPPPLRGWFVALAIIGVLNAAIAAAYYLRIAASLYFRSAESPRRADGGLRALTAAALCAVLAISIGVFAGPLWSQSNLAAKSARTSAVSAPQPRLAQSSR